MPRTELIFACQWGTEVGSGEKRGLLETESSLLLATRETIDCKNGFRALWASCTCVEEFFMYIGLKWVKSPGLWYISIEYNEEDISEYNWSHLKHHLGADKEPVMVHKDLFTKLMIGVSRSLSDDYVFTGWRWV